MQTAHETNCGHQSEQRRIIETKHHRDKEKLIFVQWIHEKLLSISWEECGYKDPSLDYCSPEMFGKLKIPQCKEFIVVDDLLP